MLGRAKVWVVCFLLLLMAGTVQSEIYKWVGADGRINFSNSPPPEGNVEIVKPKPNTYQSRKLQNSGKGPSSAKSGSHKRVIMYSAVWCGICKHARRYFKKNKIPFKEYDVETSSKGRSDYKLLRGRGVPIIMIGKKRMNGFDPKLFKKMYES